MTEHTRLNRMFARLQHTMQQRTTFLAEITTGEDSDSIEAGDGLYWAYVWQHQGVTLTRIRCSKAKPFPGARYRVRQSVEDGVLEVIGVDPVTTKYFFDGLPDPEAALSVPAHAWTHRGINNLDTLLIELQQILGLQVRPADSGVAVTVAEYRPFGFAETTLDLSSLLPDGGLQRLVLVCYDTNSGDVVAVDGGTVVVGAWPYSPGDGPGDVPFDDDDIAAVEVETAYRRLAAVRLYYNQSAVAWSDVFADLRDFVPGREGWLRLDDDDPTLGGLAEKLVAGSGVTLSRQAGDTLVIAATPGSGGGSGWDVDAVPVDASAMDDEFEDASFDTGLWSEFDPDSAQSIAEADGALTLTWPLTASQKWYGVYQTLPVGDFTLVAKFTVTMSPAAMNSTAVGLVLWDDPADTGAAAQAVLYMQAAGGDAYQLDRRWPDGWDEASAAVLYPLDEASETIYVRLRRTGSTLYGDVSYDGVTWWSRELNVVTTPTAVGIGGYAGEADFDCQVEYFRYRDTYDALEEPVHGAATAGDLLLPTGLASAKPASPALGEPYVETDTRRLVVGDGSDFHAVAGVPGLFPTPVVEPLVVPAGYQALVLGEVGIEAELSVGGMLVCGEAF